MPELENQNNIITTIEIDALYRTGRLTDVQSLCYPREGKRIQIRDLMETLSRYNRGFGTHVEEFAQKIFMFVNQVLVEDKIRASNPNRMVD